MQSGACLECEAGHRSVLQQVLDHSFVALRGGAVQPQASRASTCAAPAKAYDAHRMHRMLC